MVVYHPLLRQTSMAHWKSLLAQASKISNKCFKAFQRQFSLQIYNRYDLRRTVTCLSHNCLKPESLKSCWWHVLRKKGTSHTWVQRRGPKVARVALKERVLPDLCPSRTPWRRVINHCLLIQPTITLQMMTSFGWNASWKKKTCPSWMNLVKPSLTSLNLTTSSSKML